MLSFHDFFAACSGLWMTERTYHFVERDEIERSHTEFRVSVLDSAAKRQILGDSAFSGSRVSQRSGPLTLVQEPETATQACPGFAIAFDTVSERGERVSMQLNALFVPDACVAETDDTEELLQEMLTLPGASAVSATDAEVIRGYYLRDAGYSEAGAIAGRFTYQPTRQTLEMTTFYNRSIAVDQMRFVAPMVRMRTIVTYRRPAAGDTPTQIDLIGFGVEHKQ